MNYYNNTDYKDYKEVATIKIHISRFSLEKSIKSI